MKSDNPRRKSRVCPICGKTYSEPPAISRIDGESEICSDCGILQSLATLGIDQEEQNKILETIHRHIKSITPD